MTRRSFLAAGSLALAASCGATAAKAAGAGVARGKVRFRLGMAGYTYNKFKIDETLEALERFGVHDLCVKDFHLPLTSTPAEIEAFRKKCADHGVKPYGVGPINMQTEDEAKRAFDYAAALGVPTVVGVPWKQRMRVSFFIRGTRKWLSGHGQVQLRLKDLTKLSGQKFTLSKPTAWVMYSCSVP